LSDDGDAEIASGGGGINAGNTTDRRAIIEGHLLPHPDGNHHLGLSLPPIDYHNRSLTINPNRHLILINLTLNFNPIPIQQYLYDTIRDAF